MGRESEGVGHTCLDRMRVRVGRPGWCDQGNCISVSMDFQVSVPRLSISEYPCQECPCEFAITLA